tara:strand:- start:24093 stop:24596 length:504 start_codon:yes stop_codon:yes gene_type:complete
MIWDHSRIPGYFPDRRLGGSSYPFSVDKAKRAQSGMASARKVFRRRHRLPGSGYAPVFDARLRKSRGPITVHLRPNGLDTHRLGLSVGRRFGNAVARGRFKRMIREVFRLERASFPVASDGAYDIVVTTRAHEDATLDAYRDWMTDAIGSAHRVHVKRSSQAGGSDG